MELCGVSQSTPWSAMPGKVHNTLKTSAVMAKPAPQSRARQREGGGGDDREEEIERPVVRPIEETMIGVT